MSAAAEPPPPTRRQRRRARRRARPRWRRWLYRSLVLLVVIALGTTGAELAYVAVQLHKIKRVVLHHLVKVPTKGPHVGDQTFLLIGNTSRCVLNNQQTGAFGSCAQGITGVNADVIVLLRADQKTNTISILSIPRDLVLQNVRPGGFFKIDAALADGPDQLIAAIEQDFGIPINHFAELNFDSFQNIVNALGGLKMYFPDAVYDNYSSLHISTPGCHLLNGFEALAVVRARHLWYKQNGQWLYDGNGDLSRIIRVHEFLRVLATAMENRGLANPLSDNALLGAIAPDLEIDSSLSLSDMINLLEVFHSADVSKSPEWTMPNIENFADYIYQGYDVGSVVLPTYPQDQNTIDEFLGLKKPPGSAVNPAKVTVSVMDGSGVGDGPATADQLHSLGFKIVGTGVTTPIGPIAETIVYYRPGHILQGERVVQSLSGIVSMTQGATTDGADVTVVTGSNFSVRVHHAPVAATTTTTTTPAGSTLGPPSPALQPLPSYDPRACPGTAG
jgi:LCP family protein required for cell wall assembly